MAGQQGRLSQRLAAFKQKFGQILGPKQQGYGELGQLEQPLVSHGLGQQAADSTSDSAYFQQHGVPRPGSQAPQAQSTQYAAPQGQHQAGQGEGPPPYAATSANAVPDQADELRALSGLAAEAAEILFEMAALHDSSEVASDMLDKAAQLQAQLRGMIGDFREGDEMALAQALEAFDTLTATVEEYHTTLRGGPPAAPSGEAAAGPSAGGPAGGLALQPPPSAGNPFQGGGAPIMTAPGRKPTGEEPPLISFD